MQHEQKRQEKHKLDRTEKQAEERQSESNYSKPGAKVRPRWFLVLGIGLTTMAMIIWWRATSP